MALPHWSELTKKKWFPFAIAGIIVLAIGWSLYVSRPPPQPNLDTPQYRLAETIRAKLRADPRFHAVECILPPGDDKRIVVSGEVDNDDEAEALDALVKSIPAGDIVIELQAEAPPR